MVFHTPPYSLHSVSLHDSSDFTGKGKLYRPVVLNGSLKKSDLNTAGKEQLNSKLKIGGAATLEKDLNGRKSRESIGSPNTLERRNKRFSYSASRQTSVEVPYARLLDSPSKKVLRQESSDSTSGVVYRRGSDSNKSQNNTLRVSPPKTSISDSRLTGEANVEDELEVGVQKL